MEPTSYSKRHDILFEELENKGYLGTILGFTDPVAMSKMGMQTTATIPQNLTGANKKQRIQVPQTQSQRVIILGNNYPGSSDCMAIVVSKTHELQNLMKKAVHAEALQLGDQILILGCNHSTKTIGESMVILEDPTDIAPIKENWIVPRAAIRMSDTNHQQIHFNERSKTIRVGKSVFKRDKDVPCNGMLCDGQLEHCKGCLGRTRSSENFVLSVTVEVENCPEYLGPARFFNFRSRRFTSLVFQNVAVFGGLSFQEMDRHNLPFLVIL